MKQPLEYNPWIPSKLSEKQSTFLTRLMNDGKLNEVEEHSVKYALETGEYNEGQRILFLQLSYRELLRRTNDG